MVFGDSSIVFFNGPVVRRYFAVVFFEETVVFRDLYVMLFNPGTAFRDLFCEVGELFRDVGELLFKGSGMGSVSHFRESLT